MNLPNKDKNGNVYLSYSAINTFLKDKEQFVKTYILKEPFKGNAYTDFGSRVGKALEENDFCLFTKKEESVLKQVNRLDEFERRVLLNYDAFYMVGYIDTNTFDLTEIKDYKTGGIGKDFQYTLPDYTQLCYYALGIRQETGISVKKASVEFIQRDGNPSSGLKVANVPPKIIEVDISEQRLKSVYWDTIRIAKDIEKFYESYLITNNL